MQYIQPTLRPDHTVSKLRRYTTVAGIKLPKVLDDRCTELEVIYTEVLPEARQWNSDAQAELADHVNNLPREDIQAILDHVSAGKTADWEMPEDREAEAHGTPKADDPLIVWTDGRPCTRSAVDHLVRGLPAPRKSPRACAGCSFGLRQEAHGEGLPCSSPWESSHPVSNRSLDGCRQGPASPDSHPPLNRASS